LTFRPLSEAFVRRSRYSVLLVLDTTGRCRVKKAVVCVAQLVAALITVHVVSRTGRTEYQLLLMKASDRGRNVKF